MKESYVERLAARGGPESYVVARGGKGEAWTGIRKRNGWAWVESAGSLAARCRCATQLLSWSQQSLHGQR